MLWPQVLIFPDGFFQYYSMWVSLVGTFLCVAVMFLMDWVTALITFAIVGILYFYINYRKPGMHDT